MKKKIKAIEAAALILGAMFISGISVQNINATTVQIQKEENYPNSDGKNFFVTGHGYCAGIAIDGEWWDRDIEGHIQADLEIFNYPGICPVPWSDYSLQVTNLTTGQIATKSMLPKYVYLYGFDGYGYIDNYHTEKGLSYATFRLRGHASGCNFEAKQRDETTTVTKENFVTFQHEPVCFGSIYGSTSCTYGPMVCSSVVCVVTIYSEEAEILKSRISWGRYKIDPLPIGYTYTVTAGPYNETVTLTSDEPHAMVNFGFDEDDFDKQDSKLILSIQNIRARLLSKLFSFFSFKFNPLSSFKK